MITQDKEKQLYEKVVISKKIKTKELNELGFNSNDITKLIESGKIVRLERGVYEFIDLEGLYNYGYKFIISKQYDVARKVFEACYAYGLRHQMLLLQLFYVCINNNKFEESLIYLKDMFNTDDPLVIKDNNFYLLLLSYLVSVPIELQERLKEIKQNHKSVMLDSTDQRFNNYLRFFQNKFRGYCYNGIFSLAMKQYKSNSNAVNTGIRQVIEFKLLAEICNRSIKEKQDLIKLIKNSKYEEALKFLEEKIKLNHYENIIFLLLKKLIDLKNGIFSEKSEFIDTNKLYDAINDENYERALQLSKEFSIEKGINDDNAVEMLLEEIIKIIKSEREKKQELEKLNFVDIVTSVIQDDFQTSIAKIKLYLEQINCTEYEFLVISLFKMGLKDHDLAFSKMILELSRISDKESYEFNFDKYIQKFYQCLANNDYITAKIYLDILVHYGKEDKYVRLVSGLQRIFEASQRIVENNHRIESFEQSLDKLADGGEKNEIVHEYKPVTKKEESVQVQEIVMVEESTNDELLDHEYQSDVEFISEKAANLNLNESIIILRPMDDIRRKRIHEIARKTENVSSFSIGRDKNRRIVLKYTKEKPKDIDLSELLKEGNSLYFNKQYAKSINVLEEALSYIYNPKAFIFALLGIAYLKTKRKDKALNYLIIATELSKLENDFKYDFSDIIDDLTSPPSSNPNAEKKPRFKMHISEFNPAEINQYQIKGLKDILTSILLEQEDINCVFEGCGLTEDQSNIVRLIIARYYYSVMDFEVGDKIFKIVERSKNKSKVVKELFNEIRLNKQFYQHRENPDPVALILSRKIEQSENQ